MLWNHLGKDVSSVLYISQSRSQKEGIITNNYVLNELPIIIGIKRLDAGNFCALPHDN